jgi:rubredoxin
VFACEGCGYELMPARGREGKFFAKDFKCPICGAPKEKFWDVNDPDDPRNQEPEPEEEAPKASSPNKDEGGDSKGKKKEE